MVRTTGQNIARAGMQSVAGRLGGKVIDFATLLVLAQLLLPDDFGLIALAMTVILLIEALTEVPLTQPILRAETPTPDYYDTAFTLGVLRAVVLAVVVTALAWPVGAFYDEARLPLLIVALTAAPIMRSLISPRMADFTRAYDMWPDMAMNLVGKAAAFGVVVTVALVTRSHWAIAMGTITTPLVMALMSYVAAPYRPRLSLARWGAFKDIVGWNSVNQLFGAFSFQIDRILLGRTLSTATLGRYAMASDLTGVAFQGILFPLASPLTVATAKAATLEGRVRAWGKILNAVLCLMGAILLGLTLLAGPIVAVLLGEVWRDAAPMLSWLALTSLPGIVGFVLGPLAVSLFKPQLIAQRTFIDLAVKVPLMLIGITWFGLWGAIAARAISGVVAMIFSFTAAGQLLHITVMAQMRMIHRTVAGLIVFAVVGYVLCPAVDPASQGVLPRIVLGLQVGLVFAAALVAQLVAMLGLWRMQGKPEDGIEGTMLGWLPRRRG
ncbi:polysaccharide transporter, PST family [Loktanella fryxellensis]|uniref:Polysaccharide transporter, PST family n=1 Tax=Loktanella fryxellensis TaxID=245187 RepID=A0A1H8H4U2_9RHOB|nr:oligosaccharide flippase family protein [Loktanella fryxellensis]SEN51372.1 polysaccharide transporter, PST family [Loktanella fryxellensis]